MSIHPLGRFPSLAKRRLPFLLDGGPVPGGECSMMGADPHRLLRCYGNQVEWEERSPSGTRFERRQADPLMALQEAAGRRDYAIAIGFLSYDLGRQIESVPSLSTNELGLPDMHFAFYSDVIRHERSAPSPGRKASEDDGQAIPAVEDGCGRLSSSLPATQYRHAVAQARQHLMAGDIYQVNLCQRIRVSMPPHCSPFSLYRRLRAESPAPFGAFLDLGDFQVLSNSPERFLRLDRPSGRLETWPIKGTCRRDDDPRRDAEAARALQADPKERAEHIMIVDLERNDLGRVCSPGSIGVEGMLRVESFAHVHHLVSTVRGQLPRNVGLAEILRATFPGGSITGAPKVKAMEIAERLEPTRRGIYCGALGYLLPDGSFDLNLTIRTAVIRDGHAHIYAGGGVVADSTPEGELRESWLKATAFLKALGAQPTDAELVLGS